MAKPSTTHLDARGLPVRKTVFLIACLLLLVASVDAASAENAAQRRERIYSPIRSTSGSVSLEWAIDASDVIVQAKLDAERQPQLGKVHKQQKEMKVVWPVGDPQRLRAICELYEPGDQVILFLWHDAKEKTWRIFDYIPLFPEKSLQALKSLEIEGPFTDAGLEFLKKLPNLRELILKGHFSDKGMVHLSGITRLESLTLVSDKQTGSGLSSLSRLPKLRALRFVGQPKGVSLAALSDWQHLEVLNLASDKTDDALLASIGPIPNLKSLSLEEARVTNDGLAALEKLVTLQELDLWNTDISDEGLQHLVPLKQLRALRLGDCGRIDLIGTPGLTLVASLSSLDFLDVSAVDITNEQLAIVTACPSLKKIVFNIRHNTIIDEWKKVQARHPDLLRNEGNLVIRAARMGNRYLTDMDALE